ncbi:PH domain-containing protein [Bacillus carboniphilus]|uniref:PH domain-containing protein n=1 Tax=Bacillus carboniphilus TaxID=86663 RepID=A0ABP3FQE4_9BACI
MMNPSNRISKKALSVWRITGIIHSLIALLVPIGFFVLPFFLEGLHWFSYTILFVWFVLALFLVIIIPKLRWRKWWYEVREQEIELQHGILIVKNTLVPMIRVQHVDTVQGPILKKYGLATIVISTAATSHEIPALAEEEAEQLRYSISRLARVAEEDV